MARILVVEDEPNISELIACALRPRGHEVDTAGGGAAGRSTRQQRGRQRPPRLRGQGGDVGVDDLDAHVVGARLEQGWDGTMVSDHHWLSARIAMNGAGPESAPETTTTTGGIVPAAVISIGKKRPCSCAAISTAR